MFDIARTSAIARTGRTVYRSSFAFVFRGGDYMFLWFGKFGKYLHKQQDVPAILALRVSSLRILEDWISTDPSQNSMKILFYFDKYHVLLPLR